MDKVEKAVELYKKDYLCSQSVFGAFCEDYGINIDLGLRLSKFLGFGFLFRGDYCGAISGALLIYGLKYSSGTNYDELSDEIFYQTSKEHIKRFTAIHGSCICSDLLTADLSTEEGMAFIRENNLFNLRCPHFVKDSAKILTQITEEMDKRDKGYSIKKAKSFDNDGVDNK
jgi:C_GCAxxG_C_C family probable redox protein